MSAVPATQLADRQRRRNTARVLSTTPAGTDLELTGPEGPHVHVVAWPDAAGAGRVARMLDRVLWQRLEVREGAVSGVVAGTRHRRPVQVRVGGDVALGLVEGGVPTVARVVDGP